MTTPHTPPGRPAAPPVGAAARQAAATVTVSPQAAAAWGRARRRLEVVRDRTGRVATLGGATTAVVVLADPGLMWAGLAATTAVTAAGVGTLRLQMPHAGHQKATASVLYTLPGTGLGALLVAEGLAADATWGGAAAVQVAAALVWTAATWLLRPGRIARRMAVAPPPAQEPPERPELDTGLHPAARWWATRAATEGGPAAGTVLTDVELTGERAMTATIRATAPGQPVPDIPIRRLSALMDLPEDDIAITAVPGRGAGVRRLTIGKPDAAASDPAAVWAERIAPAAMPGAVLTGIRIGRPGAAAPVKAKEEA